MSHLVATKLRHLAGEFDDLKVRLRIALAGELARQVATAVGDVVRAVVGPPGSESDRRCCWAAESCSAGDFRCDVAEVAQGRGAGGHERAGQGEVGWEVLLAVAFLVAADDA